MQYIGAVGAVLNVLGIASLGYFLQWSSRRHNAVSPQQLVPVYRVGQAIVPSAEETRHYRRGVQSSTALLEPQTIAEPASEPVQAKLPEPKDSCTTTKESLHQLISKLILPIIIASALWKVQLTREYLEIPLYLGGLNLALWVVVNRLLKHKGQAACAAFGNVTYVGLPILSSLYGLSDRVIVTVGLCEITTTLLNVLTRNGRDWRFLKNPCLWAIPIGLGLRVFPYPQLLDPTLKNLAIWMSLTMIMVLGMTIKLSMKWNKTLWLICAVKLIVMPALMLAICRNPLLVMEAAMPCQLLTTVLYRDEDISGYCFASLLLCLVTIPGWFFVLSMLN
jgi:predicted permease